MDKIVEDLTENIEELSRSIRSLKNVLTRSIFKKDKAIKNIVATLIKKHNDDSDALDNYRKNCKHEFEYKGHGHNYAFYECHKCGESEDR